jgi:hypothetical protein
VIDTPPGGDSLRVPERISTSRGGAASGRPSTASRDRSRPDPQINFTERLLVSSVSVSEVKLTVIGGLQLGENVAVAVRS